MCWWFFKLIFWDFAQFYTECLNQLNGIKLSRWIYQNFWFTYAMHDNLLVIKTFLNNTSPRYYRKASQNDLRFAQKGYQHIKITTHSLDLQKLTSKSLWRLANFHCRCRTCPKPSSICVPIGWCEFSFYVVRTNHRFSFKFYVKSILMFARERSPVIDRQEHRLADTTSARRCLHRMQIVRYKHVKDAVAAITLCNQLQQNV